MKMKSIDEAIGANELYFTETVGTATARTVETLGKGVSNEHMPQLIQAILGLYLTGKAMRLNLSRHRAITTRDDVIYFSSASLAPLKYVQFPESAKERTAVIHGVIDAAIQFKCLGEIGRMLMLTGKGLQAVNDIMKKEAMYS